MRPESETASCGPVPGKWDGGLIADPYRQYPHHKDMHADLLTRTGTDSAGRDTHLCDCVTLYHVTHSLMPETALCGPVLATCTSQ